MSQHTVQLTVNGEAVVRDVPSRRLLADFLRDDLNLTGTKRGCETGICGACSVLFNGDVVKSCLCLAVQADGASAPAGGRLEAGRCAASVADKFYAMRISMRLLHPGFLMTACDMLKKNPTPTESQVRHGLSGNLCRCTGYQGIVESILDAAEKLNGN